MGWENSACEMTGCDKPFVVTMMMLFGEMMGKLPVPTVDLGWVFFDREIVCSLNVIHCRLFFFWFKCCCCVLYSGESIAVPLVYG